MRSSARVCTVFTMFGLLAALNGCGSAGASSNDQGGSVTAKGWFAAKEDGTFDKQNPSGLTGLIVKLGENEFAAARDFVDVSGYLGVENRLPSQFVNIKRVDCDHTIPGAPGFVIPRDSFALSYNLNAYAPQPLIVDGRITSQDGALPEKPDTAYSQIAIVSSNMMQFLNVNRNSLPELPFRMVTSCRAIVVTEAGDTLETNDAPITIEFVESTSFVTTTTVTTVGGDSAITNSAEATSNSSSNVTEPNSEAASEQSETTPIQTSMSSDPVQWSSRSL